jgi:type III secretion system FlhB-like substrate exporter
MPQQAYDLIVVGGGPVGGNIVESAGRAKIVIDEDREVTVGATFLGTEVGLRQLETDAAR